MSEKWAFFQVTPALIRTEIKVGAAILIHVFILPCMKVKLIFICIIHKARI